MLGIFSVLWLTKDPHTCCLVGSSQQWRRSCYSHLIEEETEAGKGLATGPWRQGGGEEEVTQIFSRFRFLTLRLPFKAASLEILLRRLLFFACGEGHAHMGGHTSTHTHSHAHRHRTHHTDTHTPACVYTWVQADVGTHTHTYTHTHEGPRTHLRIYLHH